MPKIWPVLSQSFTAIFARLGIQAVPAGPQWFLSDTIVPVSLLDSEITLQSNVIEAIEVVLTAGRQLAPVAGAVLADTGALGVGNYHFKILCSITDPLVDAEFVVARRNAADTLNVWAHNVMIAGVIGTSHGSFLFEVTVALAANERLKVSPNANFGAGSVTQVTIFQRGPL